MSLAVSLPKTNKREKKKMMTMMVGRSNMKTQHEWPSKDATMLTLSLSETICRIFQLAPYTFCLTIANDC